MTLRRSSDGFTLIELSIALVIIALIVSGVVVGRDLIRQAHLRSVLSDIDRYNTAVNTFKSKYQCLPGDCPNATTFWGSDNSCPDSQSNTLKTATCNGNGDGWTGTYNVLLIETLEIFRFWQQLANAGLIEGQYSGSRGCNNLAVYDYSRRGINLPSARLADGAYQVGSWKSAVPSNTAFFFVTYGNILYFGKPYAQQYCNGSPVSGLLTTADAQSLDTKVDDGKPGYGYISALNSNWQPNCISSTNPTSATYLTAQQGANCSLIFRMSY